MTREEYADFLVQTNYDYKFYEGQYPKRQLSEGQMVQRAAPSPTGYIHLGNLYAYFSVVEFAKQSKGISILRIEDTDKKRTVENGVPRIIEDLKKFGMIFDEDPEKGGKYGPYIQSEREDIYKAFAKKLIIEDKAYPCFLSPDELNEIREMQASTKKRIGIYGKYAQYRNLTMEEVIEKINNRDKYIIRMKSPGNFENKVILNDLIKGKIEFPENDIDEVIIKSDGLPTYHFAHAVDDHLMGTTHVLRGDEWVSSYPIHDQMFKLLGFELPLYSHIAPINIKDGDSVRKISKRKDPEAQIAFYHEKGIPVEAVRLYLATINNTDFEEWYINNPKKTIDDFEFKFNKMPIGGTLFDLEKLMSISKIYFSNLSANALYNEALKYYEEYNKEFYELISKYKDYTINILNIEREIERPRKDIDSYSSIKNEISYMFDELFNYGEIEVKEYYNYDILEDYIENFYSELDDKETWFNKIKELCPKYGFTPDSKEYKKNPESFKGSVAQVCELIRVAITGRTQTPDLYELLRLLGKERISERFKKFNEICIKAN